jgi:uncharacterized protein
MEITDEIWMITSMERDEAINRLQQHQADFNRIGVDRLYMFGSTARGEAGRESDVDLFSIIRKASSASSTLMDVREFAAKILGRETDIMTRDSLHKILRQEIEAIALRVF